MDHVVIPIGPDHRKAIEALAAGAASAAGIEDASGGYLPHVSVLAYEHVPQTVALKTIEASVREIAPFVMHAHGYGFFTGEHPTNLTLHVPVVRAPAIDDLHARLWEALRRAGAHVAGWSAPDLWSPHLTILDRVLDPSGLGAAVTSLARRHHPSWNIPVDRVMLTGGWRDRSGRLLRLGLS